MGLKVPEEVKALIFDCDGTIINSESIHCEAVSAALNECGLKMDIETVEKRFRGYHDGQIYDELFNENSNIRKDDFLTIKTNKLLKTLNEIPIEVLHKLLAPGFLDAIRNLSEKYIFALVSSSEDAFLQTLTQRLEIKNYFKLIVHGNTTAFPKPSPAPYTHTLRELGLHQDEVLIFEDSVPGLTSAVASGCEVLWMRAFHPEVTSDIHKVVLSCDDYYWLS
ncbi:MAG: HAD family hydrolase [Bacteriovoracaceae bacterium]